MLRKIKNPEWVLLRLALACAVFSMINIFNSILHASQLRYLFFAGAAFFALRRKSGRISVNKYVYTWMFAIVYTIVSLFLIRMIYGIGNTTNISLFAIPLFIYLTSYNIPDVSERYTELVYLYIICVTIVAIGIIATFDLSGWMESEQYQYNAGSHKNTAGQLLGSALVLSLFAMDKQTIKRKVFAGLVIILLVATMVLVQCRSALIGVAVVIVVYTLLYSEHKVRDMCILAAVVTIVMNSQALIDIISHSFFIDKYSVGGQLDFNKFTSGRTDHWIETIKIFLDYPLIGCQAWYVDNFFLNMLADGGIVGGTIMLVFIVKRVCLNLGFFRNIKGYSVLRNGAFALLLFSLTISMFEANPPMGPGVASVMFWVTAAAVDQKYSMGN